MVITGGKSFSASKSPNEFSGDAEDHDGEFDMLMTLVSVLVGPSEADVIGEVVPWEVPSKVHATAGLAGLASAGKESAEQLSVLAMETALLSMLVSPVKPSIAFAGKAGDGHGMEVGGPRRGLWSELPFSSSAA